MKIKDMSTWFYAMEKKEDSDTAANRYFATLSIMFAAIAGAVIGAGGLLHSWFDWNTELDKTAVYGVLIVVCGVNLTESVLATKTAGKAAMRSFLLVFFMTAAYWLGYAGSIIMLVAGAIDLALMLASGAITEVFKPSEKRDTFTVEGNGQKTELHDEGGGYAKDDSGRYWQNEGGSTWRPDE